MTKKFVRLSKQLSWLLRHGAYESGLHMDEAGWVETGDVLASIGITAIELDDAVATNDKGRLEVRGSRIRACQGHSLTGTPVTREALEESWTLLPAVGSLWHGTRASALAGIAQLGLVPAERTHVHLAESVDSPVGRRSSVDVLLEVSATRLGDADILIYRAPNGVILVRFVPKSALVAAHAHTPKGVDAVASQAEHFTRD